MLEIRKSLSRDKWFYCRSELNPADLITRTNLDLSNSIWFEGPTFLYHEVNDLSYESHLFGTDEEIKPMATQTYLQTNVEKVLLIAS